MKDRGNASLHIYKYMNYCVILIIVKSEFRSNVTGHKKRILLNIQTTQNPHIHAYVRTRIRVSRLLFTVGRCTPWLSDLVQMETESKTRSGVVGRHFFVRGRSAKEWRDRRGKRRMDRFDRTVPGKTPFCSCSSGGLKQKRTRVWSLSVVRRSARRSAYACRDGSWDGDRPCCTRAARERTTTSWCHIARVSHAGKKSGLITRAVKTWWRREQTGAVLIDTAEQRRKALDDTCIMIRYGRARVPSAAPWVRRALDSV